MEVIVMAHPSPPLVPHSSPRLWHPYPPRPSDGTRGVHRYCLVLTTHYTMSRNPALSAALGFRTFCGSCGLCHSLLTGSWPPQACPSSQSALSKTQPQTHQASALNALKPPGPPEFGDSTGTLISRTKRRHPGDR